MRIQSKQLSIIFIFVLSVMVLVSSGCSVVMAVRQPSKKDLSVLKRDVHRDRILAELGQPISSSVQGEERVEIYQFEQGYHSGVKAGRALFHGAADVFTLGLWEVVGTPSELVFDGQEMSVKVIYDENDIARDVVVLKGKGVGRQYAERKTDTRPKVRVTSAGDLSERETIQREKAEPDTTQAPRITAPPSVKDQQLGKIVEAPNPPAFAQRKNSDTAEVRITPVIPAAAS